MYKRIINIIVWTIIGLYATVTILLHIPVIQNFIGNGVSDALCKKFGTKVSVGRVDLGFINRIIIDDSQMLDQKGEQMLQVARISVKVNIIALTRGKIEITSAQFFGLKANLYKENYSSAPNYQFIIDSLASKDDKKKKQDLSIQINSLIIRNGNIRYRYLSHINSTKKFSPYNIDAKDISAHIIVNQLSNDSLNIKAKRISFKEKSGLNLVALSFHSVISRNGAQIHALNMKLPNSELKIKNIKAIYNTNNGGIEMASLKYNGSINYARIRLSDAYFLEPKLRNCNKDYFLTAIFNGTESSVGIKKLSLSNNGSTSIEAIANIKKYAKGTKWFVKIIKINTCYDDIQTIAKAITKKDVPLLFKKAGNINIKGYAGGMKKTLASKIIVHTDLGNISLAIEKNKDRLAGNIETSYFNLGKLLSNDKIGELSAKLNIKGTSKEDVNIAGKVYDIKLNKYKYSSVDIDATYHSKVIKGRLRINDPNIKIAAEGSLDNSATKPCLQLSANIENLNPSRIHITNKWKDASFSCNILADIKGNNVNNADGKIVIKDFVMSNIPDIYSIKNLMVHTGYDKNTHFLDIDSDFGNIDITGHFNYNSLARSVLNMIASKLPTMPGLKKTKIADNNNFTVNATIKDTKWMKFLLGIPLNIKDPLNIYAKIDDKNEKINMICTIPEFIYNNDSFRNALVNIETTNDTLKTDIQIRKIMDNGKYMQFALNAGACNNKLKTSLEFQNSGSHKLHGIINASTVFAKNDNGQSTAYVNILKSRATIGDTIWHIQPAYITYFKNNLQVDGFSVKHGDQYINVDGIATNNNSDSLRIALNNIDIRYILDLVNFHSVDFYGMASGKAYIAGTFSKSPQIGSDLTVKDFLFEKGRMGTLFAHIGYDSTEGKIDIDAKADDTEGRQTLINGYVSPKHNYIDLGIKARGTRAEFMESFCNSFMDNVNAKINGEVNVVGPLNNINLVGKAVVNGSVRMSALNTTYRMRNDSVTFVPDEIIFKSDTLRDNKGNIGVMNGSLYHQHLTNLSYDLKIKAKNLLAYDTHNFEENSFYGTAFVTGDCAIRGKSGEVVIDVNAVTEKNSILVYNVSDHTTASSNDYIHWKTHNTLNDTNMSDSTFMQKDNEKVNLSTNIKLNFMINCNPNATLKLIMDERTGDYITLNGDGMLRATYFNKGSFDIYGNYIIDHGVYKLTVQNIIKKDFIFQKGSTIAFGGDPYNATLDMKALYILNSVNMSDLNIGRSFSNNNVRVNCLMNITGNPASPKVDFSLDMPTLSNDAKQMVYSLLNAEEEMNQQVLYLLAVGRFYAQNTNNSGNSPQQYSQTSLAMQSFLSGTISQQINNVLSNVINNRNWNFGANISTGTEGFNDAEYEGLLSGRLLNNRLLINGQFGYRDNPYATTGIIGDFDLKYLLFPNGNLAINVYNKTNDRYFTRNSLNTQGLGIIMKKDFTRLSDLFFSRKRKNAEKKQHNNTHQ